MLFLITDLAFIQNRNARLIFAISRYGFSVVLLLMIRVLQRAGSFRSFASVVTILETGYVLLIFAAAWLYETPDFMIQSMGLISYILVIFIVPNYRANMLVLSIVGAAAYFAFSYYLLQNTTITDLVATLSYVSLTIILCTVTSFGNDTFNYKEFIEKSRLEETSATDFLTGAVTRARLEEEAQRWMSFCRRQKLPLCLVFLDVDNLKRINDQHSHAAGDIVLRQLSEIMRKQLRNSDTIARWGGDEFVLLLPNVSLPNAVLLLDRIKLIVSKTYIDQVGVISCSYGVVEMGADSTYQQLLEEADALMYRSKTNGKGDISYRN